MKDKRNTQRQRLTHVEGQVANGVFTECLFGLQVVPKITSITILMQTRGYRGQLVSYGPGDPFNQDTFEPL